MDGAELLAIHSSVAEVSAAGEGELRSWLRLRDDELFRRLDEWFSRQQVLIQSMMATDVASEAEGSSSCASLGGMPMRGNSEEDSLRIKNEMTRKNLDERSPSFYRVSSMNSSAHRSRAEHVSIVSFDPLHQESFSDDPTCIERLVSSTAFEAFFGLAVFSNAAMIGVQVEYTSRHGDGGTPTFFTVMTYVYAIVFLVEVIMRLLAEGLPYFWSSVNARWNYLDVCIVCLSFIEIVLDQLANTANQAGFSTTGNVRTLRIIRMTRLIRVIRVVKMIKFIRGLRSLVYSIMHTLKSVFWAMTLLLMVLYVFGIIFTDCVTSYVSEEAGSGSEDLATLKMYFGSLHRSMHTLFRCITNGTSWEVVVEPLGTLSWSWVYVFTFYIVFCVFAMLNVMTAVFCQSAIEGAARDNEEVGQAMLADMKRNKQLMEDLFVRLRCRNRNTISLGSMELQMDNPDTMTFFRGLDLHPHDAWTLFQLLDKDKTGDVTLDEFMEGLVRLKGEAKAIDVASLALDCRRTKSGVMEMSRQIEVLEAHVRQIQESLAPKKPRSKFSRSKVAAPACTPKSELPQDTKTNL